MCELDAMREEKRKLGIPQSTITLEEMIAHVYAHAPLAHNDVIVRIPHFSSAIRSRFSTFFFSGHLRPMPLENDQVPLRDFYYHASAISLPLAGR